MRRYSRQVMLEDFGESSVEILKNKSVAVVGAGAVAASALPLLVGSGIGHIKICDGDYVSMSNLHRQTLFRENDVGKNKALVAARELQKLNSEIQIDFSEKKLQTLEEVTAFVKDCDLCLDMTDSFATRTLISEGCALTNTREIACSTTEYVSQIFMFDSSFKFADVAPNDETEGAQKFAIFPPASHLSGVWGAGLAIKILLNIEPFQAGYMQNFDFKNNQFSKYFLK